MAKGKRAQKGPSKNGLWTVLAVLAVAAVFWAGRTLGFLPEQEEPSSAVSQAAAVPEGTLQICYFDVGQGDAQLVQFPGGSNVLIDAGTSSTEDELVEELKALGVETLDLVVATHPHADHIGGMAAAIEAFEVGGVVMPRVADSDTPTTKTYEGLLETIAEKGLSITPAEPGKELLSEGGASLTVLAPNGESYADLNNYSVVLRLTFGEDAFLFTGDAETESEDEMLDAGFALSSTVLKCGHHGSETSTSQNFLDAVAPQYAVISCGVDNDYGHPDAVTLDKLSAAGVEVFRTDLQGTVVARSEGSGVTMTALGKDAA